MTLSTERRNMKLDKLDWELYGAIILAIILWGAVFASIIRLPN